MGLLLLCLGNPGTQYAMTRHNVGFLIADQLAKQHQAVFRRRKNYRYAWLSLPEGEIFICKPDTYMNRSGEVFPSVFTLSRMQRADLLVVTDNYDLPVGRLRLKRRGSGGGHNGLRSIEQNLGTRDFSRLYVGIGSPERDAHSHVLGRWKKEDSEQYTQSFAEAARIIIDLLSRPIDELMQTTNHSTT